MHFYLFGRHSTKDKVYMLTINARSLVKDTLEEATGCPKYYIILLYLWLYMKYIIISILYCPHSNNYILVSDMLQGVT